MGHNNISRMTIPNKKFNMPTLSWTPCLLAKLMYGKQRINGQLLFSARWWIDVVMMMFSSYGHYCLLMKLFAKLQ